MRRMITRGFDVAAMILPLDLLQEIVALANGMHVKAVHRTAAGITSDGSTVVCTTMVLHWLDALQENRYNLPVNMVAAMLRVQHSVARREIRDIPGIVKDKGGYLVPPRVVVSLRWSNRLFYPPPREGGALQQPRREIVIIPFPRDIMHMLGLELLTSNDARLRLLGTHLSGQRWLRGEDTGIPQDVLERLAATIPPIVRSRTGQFHAGDVNLLKMNGQIFSL